MGRKRRDEGEQNGVAVLDPPPGDTSPPAQTGNEPAGLPAAPKQRPVASFAAMTDRTTRIEVAVWAWQVKVSETEEYTQYSLGLNRSWRDKDGNWANNGFYRAHDVPVQLFLLQQAYQWCLLQRTEIRTAADEVVPF